MKTPEEINAIKEEVEILNNKLNELTEEELAQVVGGMAQTEELKDAVDSYEKQLMQAQQAQATADTVAAHVSELQSNVAEIQTNVAKTVLHEYRCNHH